MKYWDNMSKTVSEIQEDIIDEFTVLDGDREMANIYLMELGNKLDALPDQFRTDDYIVKGCQSKVWLHAEHEAGKVKFLADSDAVITKGLIAMLVRVLSNHSAKEIMEADLSFLDEIGVREHLSPNRSNGLNAMLKQMKYYAIAMHAKENPNG